MGGAGVEDLDEEPVSVCDVDGERSFNCIIDWKVDGWNTVAFAGMVSSDSAIS